MEFSLTPEPAPTGNAPPPPRDNLISDLTFCITQILSPIATPEQCYLPDGHALIRACAGALPSEVEALIPKLAAKFGKDWRVQRFRANIRETKAELTVQAPSNGLLCSDNGSPKPILANAITKLTATLSVGFDTFADKIRIMAPSPWGTEGTWRDIDEVSAANYLQHAGVSVSSATANEAAFFIANQSPFHPVRDYLTGLKWDGTERLDHLFSYYFGCPISKWVCDVSRMWMVSAVARIMRPGCIAKYMVVMEGPQDKGKSNGLRALVNGHLHGDAGIQWFRDNMPPIDHKDIGVYMQGVWIIEVAELSSLKRSEWEGVKAFISSPRDSFRRAYGRNLQDYPRQCVFAGTTNEDRWGGDQSGLTRFWPMRVGKILIDTPDGPCILRDRDQLWAEAYYVFNDWASGRVKYDHGRGPWWGDEEFDKLARVEQSERSPDDTRLDRVVDALSKLTGHGEEYVLISDICKDLGYSERERDSYTPSIGRCLAKLGWVRRHRRNVAGGYAYEKE